MFQNASKKLRINARRTMDIAQKLYTKGYISYPRTETNQFSRNVNLVELVQHQADKFAYFGFFSGKKTHFLRLLTPGGVILLAGC